MNDSDDFFEVDDGSNKSLSDEMDRLSDFLSDDDK